MGAGPAAALRSVLCALALGVALLLLAPPAPALAAAVRNGAAAVVGSGETIDDDLFATGQTVTVAGRVGGDVFAAGQSVVVTGTIDGDLIAVAQQVVVDGTVTGDVRAVGAVVTINGQVGHSLTGVAQQLNVGSSGRIGGGLVAAGGTISAFGPVGRGVTAGAGVLQLGGPVGGSVLAWAETLSLGPGARVAGDLDYRSEREVAVPSGVVGGRVQFTRIEREPRQEPVLNGLLTLGSLLCLAGATVLGAVALTLAPRGAARAVELAREQPLPIFGLGLLALVGPPVVALLIAVTLVGIPLALVLGALYACALLLATPAAALVLGSEAARLAGRRPLPILAALLVGLIGLHLVTHLPLIGGLIGFLTLTFGLGLIVQSVRRWRRTLAIPT